jgi:CheY-like chemotaxis protein
MRVLVVEDDANDVLSSDGPRQAERGLEGRRGVRRRAGAPRARRRAATTHVILDLKIPRKNGLEVLAQIRSERARDIRVVVLTSSAERSTRTARRSSGSISTSSPVDFTNFLTRSTLIVHT